MIRLLVICFFLSACHTESMDRSTSQISKNNNIQNSSARMPDSVRNYLLSALDTMKRYSIRTNIINWEEIKNNAFRTARGAVTYQQTYPAIKEAIKALGDKHSFFKTSQQYKEWNSVNNTKKVKRRLPLGRMDERYAVISIATFTSGNPQEELKYAIALHKVIKELDMQNPEAWIIDLRYNRGGNMWPMLAGIGPLLESEGPLGSFITIDNKKVEWKYSHGEAMLGNEPMIKVPNAYTLKNKNMPVAIFTSGNTASSGEAIVISFIGRPNTKIFGEPTAGLSTANSNHTLKDSAQLILTSAVLADRTGKKYGQKIIPNEDFSEEWYYMTWFQFVILKGQVQDWIKSIKS